MGACNCAKAFVDWTAARATYEEACSRYWTIYSQMYRQKARVLTLTTILASALAAIPISGGVAEKLILESLTTLAQEIDKLDRLVFEVSAHEQKMEVRKAIAEEKKATYIACQNSLIECSSCGVGFKPQCVRQCQGCGEYFCVNCFDEEIEAQELSQ